MSLRTTSNKLTTPTPPQAAGGKPAPATGDRAASTTGTPAPVPTGPRYQDGFGGAQQAAATGSTVATASTGASGGSNPPVGDLGNGATYAPVQNGQLFVTES